MFRSSYQQKEKQQQQQQSQPEAPVVDGSSSKEEDPSCRTCNDFKSWSKQQQKQKHSISEKVVNVATGGAAVSAAYSAPRQDCPLDKARLGIYTWSVLHTMAAFYSSNPTDTEKRDMRTFFEVLSRLYPCEYCAREFRQDIEVCPINVNSQQELSLWLCKIHNRVNTKLGKPIFDCTRVNERWRDGWLDGSCD